MALINISHLFTAPFSINSNIRLDRLDRHSKSRHFSRPTYCVEGGQDGHCTLDWPPLGERQSAMASGYTDGNKVASAVPPIGHVDNRDHRARVVAPE
jgi:hypothetical protein